MQQKASNLSITTKRAKGPILRFTLFPEGCRQVFKSSRIRPNRKLFRWNRKSHVVWSDLGRIYSCRMLHKLQHHDVSSIFGFYCTRVGSFCDVDLPPGWWRRVVAWYYDPNMEQKYTERSAKRQDDRWSGPRNCWPLRSLIKILLDCCCSNGNMSWSINKERLIIFLSYTTRISYLFQEKRHRIISANPQGSKADNLVFLYSYHPKGAPNPLSFL